MPMQGAQATTESVDGDLDRNLANFAQLLLAHEELIQQTTEDAVIRLANGLTDLQTQLATLQRSYPEEAGLKSALRNCLDLQMSLQFHDILSQQFDAIRVGMESLAETCPPDQDGWLDQQIARLEAAYVMQDQWALHHAHFGRAAEIEDDATDVTLF